MQKVNETINIKEEYSVFTDDYSFIFYCKGEFEIALNKSKRDNLDYLKLYSFLHLVLEISLSQLFRQFVLGHVYLKTTDKLLTTEEMDKKDIKEKFETLSHFLPTTDVDKLKGWYCNFAVKRNKILHGHAVGEKWVNGIGKVTRIKDWFNEQEVNAHLKNYNKIVNLMRDSIDKLPAFTASGKKDMKNILYSF